MALRTLKVTSGAGTGMARLLTNDGFERNSQGDTLR